MGNFEKVVVLLILLVCVIVLSISLSTPEVSAEDGQTNLSVLDSESVDPLREKLAERKQLEDSPSIAGLIDPALSATSQRESARLERGAQIAVPGTKPSASEVVVLPKPARLDPLLSSLVEAGDGRQVALASSAGLRSTVSPDFMIYTCLEGDDWSALSKRFYGDKRHSQLLQNANETLESLLAGNQILVPVYELNLEPAKRQPAEPRGVVEQEKNTVRRYVVQSGDNLSTISSDLYGTGSRWMEIFDANRDLLDDPHSLKVGQELTIP